MIKLIVLCMALLAPAVYAQQPFDSGYVYTEPLVYNPYQSTNTTYPVVLPAAPVDTCEVKIEGWVETYTTVFFENKVVNAQVIEIGIGDNVNHCLTNPPGAMYPSLGGLGQCLSWDRDLSSMPLAPADSNPGVGNDCYSFDNYQTNPIYIGIVAPNYVNPFKAETAGPGHTTIWYLPTQLSYVYGLCYRLPNGQIRMYNRSWGSHNPWAETITNQVRIHGTVTYYNTYGNVVNTDPTCIPQ